MIEIKDLLGKFDSLLTSEVVKKATIRDVLRKILDLKIESDDISIKNSVVYVNIKPIYKSEILVKRKEIDALLAESLGKRAPTDIH